MERILRDIRINLIIEGTSEIMHLFIAREALDPHLQLSFDMILPGRPLRVRARTAVKAARFYAVWYPSQWIPPMPFSAPEGVPSQLRGHWTFVQRASKRLARTLFHQMVIYRQKLDKRQALLFRLVDIGVDLFGMSASISRASRMKEEGTENVVELADLFCTYARRRIRANFANLNIPEDWKSYKVTQEILKGGYPWLEEGIVR